MLQRAASNAYSWWWASHIRTKQSKWLQQSLQDVEEKVEHVLKLLQEDGDSFAKRAEMYYKKRPELINFVEESFRAYRALAERYNSMSTELQNANNTIASVFPEKVQFEMDEEYDYGSPRTPGNFPQVPPTGIPKIPKVPEGDLKRLLASPTSKKLQSKKSIKASNISNTVTKSGLSKSEGHREIDKLQKEILALQTEKEFIKSSYESGLAKYWEIEKQISQKQEIVFSLKDEFGAGEVIEDEDARSLMAEAALKSCEETLAQLQEKQGKSTEEARAECERVEDARQKLKSLKHKLCPDQIDEEQLDDKDESTRVEDKSQSLNEQAGSVTQESQELDLLREKIKEHFDAGSKAPLTVTELAEKIDELVNRVITLETAVSSQNSLVNRLRAETDDLQAQIRSLEDEKVTLMDGKNNLTERLRETEAKLQGIQDLKRNVECQNNPQTHFAGASSNLDHLHEKVKVMDTLQDEEGSLFQGKSQGELEKQNMTSPVDGFVNCVKTEVKKNANEQVGSVAVKTQGEHEEEVIRLQASNDTDTQVSSVSVKIQGEHNEEEVMPSQTHNDADTQALRQSVKTQGGNKEEKVTPFQTFNDADTQESSLFVKTQGENKEETVILSQTRNDADTQALSRSVKTQGENREEKVIPSSQVSTLFVKDQELREEKGIPSLANNDIDTPASSAYIQTRENKEKKGCPSQENNDANTPISSVSLQTQGENKERKVIESLGNDNADTQLPVQTQGEYKEEKSIPSKAKNETDTIPQRQMVKESPDQVQKQLPQALGSLLDTGPGEAERESDNEPNWKQMFQEGLDDREKILLTEYATTLRNFKEVKLKLSEAEKKNRDTLFEMRVQLTELKSAIAKKDGEIQALHQKLKILLGNSDGSKELKHDDKPISDSLNAESTQPKANTEKTDVHEESLEAAKSEDEDDGEGVESIMNDEPQVISPIEEKLRMNIDAILDENLDFWLRFSTSFQQIQKFKTSFQDLYDEISKLKEQNKNKQEGSSKGGSAKDTKSEIRPIYKHIGDIQTEVTIWLEQSTLLKDELQRRLSSLCEIQEEITKALKAGVEEEEMKFTTHQAAKFQGEVLNMKQENNRVRDELQVGLDHVTALQVEIEKTLLKLNKEFGLSGPESCNETQLANASSRTGVPLRSFIFGVKPKKQRHSILSCVGPALRKHHQ